MFAGQIRCSLGALTSWFSVLFVFLVLTLCICQFHPPASAPLFNDNTTAAVKFCKVETMGKRDEDILFSLLASGRLAGIDQAAYQRSADTSGTDAARNTASGDAI